MQSNNGNTANFGKVLRDILMARPTHIAIAVWVLINAAAYELAGGFIPFDMPQIQKMPFNLRMLVPTVSLIEVFALMAVVYWLTRNRAIPDMAARAPGRAIAARETAQIIAYAAAAQVGGWIVGPLLGYRAFSFHIAGTLFGCAALPTLGEMWTWMIYNFVMFAVIPFVWFRQKYSLTQLNLRSTNRSNDAVVILIIMVIEGTFEMTGLSADFFALSPRQIFVGGSITFFFYFFGTVLPTMILVFAILLPRYLKLTGSATATVLLGGLTYAALHLVEGWSIFSSPRLGTLSILFVFLQYFSPGMIKSVLTLRTGNAWVHAFGYHAVAPHLLVDTPLFVKALAIR
ncbi:MAG: hypothetical protein ACKVOL_09105 [Novosphingobium sp.]